MTTLKDSEFQSLAIEVVERIRDYISEWSDSPDHDPGITLLQLFSFFTDQLIARPDLIPESAQLLIQQTIQQLQTLRALTCPGPSSLTRVRYFPGQLLTSDDLQTEQEYVRAKLRRHNRCMHGVGIVSGLEVTLEISPANNKLLVVVHPGFAIAPDGEDLLVSERLTSAPCTDLSKCHVILKRFDVLRQPTLGNSETGVSRIDEGVGLSIESTFPSAGVVLARLEKQGNVWRVDTHFKPPRAH